MKGGYFSCASPSCLAVCASIRRRSMVRPAIVTKANLRDARKTKPLKPLPKKIPSNPKKSRKNSDYRSSTGSGIIVTKDLISPANSSRYLLNDSAYSDIFPDSEPDFEPCLVPSVEARRFKGDEPWDVILSSFSSSSSSSSSSKNNDQVWTPSVVPISSPRLLLQHSRGEESQPAIVRPSPSTITLHDHDQVVVLRVSLHCKGCEGKVRKHISKMEGVRSFNIDFATKKVTVMGNVTPLGVLNSVSKVKNAQFWPSPQHISSPF